MTTTKALVVFSGGQDSTTCLFWAMKHFDVVEAITFDYGQRHRIELQVAEEFCKKYNIPQMVVPISSIQKLGGNSLTSDKIGVPNEVPKEGLPNTFVPGRNIIFLTIAAAYGYQRGITDLVTGVGETDYSGYPDCREDFMRSLEKTLYLGTEKLYTIHRPLMFRDKAGVWRLADELGKLDEVVRLTHTCYRGDHTTCHEWGYGCGECPACKLRKAGFEKYMESKNGLSPQ